MNRAVRAESGGSAVLPLVSSITNMRILLSCGMNFLNPAYNGPSLRYKNFFDG
jgi:hypothetical protein